MSSSFEPTLTLQCFDTREEWLSKRTKRIGGSDAAAVIGKNPYMTNERLWEIKTGRREQADISDVEAVMYGANAEEYLRELFRLDFPEYEVDYIPNNMFTNPTMPWAHASLDGWLRKGSQRGILEIKTTYINSRLQSEIWKDRIPDHYYCQVLHYLLVTGWDFAILKAQLKYQMGDELPFMQTRHYLIERKDVAADMLYLREAEKDFWWNIIEDVRPATILPDI